MAVLKPYKDGFYLWKYLPSVPLSIVGICLFFAVTIMHSWRIYRFRSWFCIYFAIGCFCEVLGYAARAACYDFNAEIAPYILQATFLVIAPVFFAASIYMTLSRIIRCVRGDHLSIIPSSKLTKIFVRGDMASLSIQGSVAGLTSKGGTTAKIANYTITAGLIIQLILLGFFFYVAINFQTQLGKQQTRESCNTARPWKATLYMIYTASALIFARSVFRVVEFVMGQNGYPLMHEWMLYVFDAMPMLIVTLIFLYWYPAHILSSASEDTEAIAMDCDPEMPGRS